MILHRICNSNFKDDISGNGAKLFGSRWNSKGFPMLYTAEHISLAALEMLVHIHYTEVPVGFHVISIFVPDNASIAELQPKKLKATWRNDIGYSAYIGD
jgi:RES domain-containing protein